MTDAHKLRAELYVARDALKQKQTYGSTGDEVERGH